MSTFAEQPAGSAQAPPSHPGGLWKTVREAVRGSHIDYTTAPIGRAVIMLAVPMVMEMAMESIFAVADVFWVAHLGADAVATVGLTESMLTHHLHGRDGPVDRRDSAGGQAHGRGRSGSGGACGGAVDPARPRRLGGD